MIIYLLTDTESYWLITGITKLMISYHLLHTLQNGKDNGS